MRKITKKKKKKEISINDVKSKIMQFVDSQVKEPILKTVDEEYSVQNEIVNTLILFNIVERLVIDHGAELYLDNLSLLSKEERHNIANKLDRFIENPNENTFFPEVHQIIDNQINKKHLLSYLIREINWISISILSTSYVSSLILIRSIFELLIGIATNQTGSMTARIDSMNYMLNDEKQLTKKCWNKLNAWAHPYQKWEKEICPIFQSHNPIYHPTLYKKCISNLNFITDIFLIIAVEKFKINSNEIKDSANKVSSDIVEYFDKFSMFIKRLK
ncbi:MAG: hypothetical protein JYX80_04380 [Candidatus Scalindua sediminis]|nr:hypothetical protein [Candidatus Scalindua sediminis]